MFKRGCVVVLVMLASACSTGSIATPTPMPTPTPPTTSTLTGGPWPIDLALPPSRVPTFRLRRTAVPTFFCNVGFKRLVPDFQRASWNLSLTITAAGYFTHTAPSVKMPFPIDVPAVQRRHVQLFGRGVARERGKPLERLFRLARPTKGKEARGSIRFNSGRIGWARDADAVEYGRKDWRARKDSNLRPPA
jgi:hypothetical protein